MTREAVCCAAVSDATVTAGASTRTGRSTGSARERREGAHDQLACCETIEDVAGRPWGDCDVKPAADEPGFVVPRVDGLPDQADLVRQTDVVGLNRRYEVGREEFELEAAVTADDPRAPTLLLG